VKPAVDDEAEVGEVAGALDYGHDLVPELGGKDEERVLLGCDGNEGVWAGVGTGLGAEVIEAKVAAGEELGVAVEVVDGGEHAASGIVDGLAGDAGGCEARFLSKCPGEKSLMLAGGEEVVQYKVRRRKF